MHFSTLITSALFVFSASAIPTPENDLAKRACPCTSIMTCYWSICLNSPNGIATNACLGACQTICKGYPDLNPGEAPSNADEHCHL